MKDEVDAKHLVEKLEQQLTDIWRPLFDPKIHPQEMAMLIRQCKDESNALFQTAQVEAVRAARIDELKEIQMSDDVHDAIKDSLYTTYIKDRLARLEQN